MGCDKTRTVIVSSFQNGNPKEVIELKLPIAKDSLGTKTVFFENGKIQAMGQTQYGFRQGKWICYFENGKPEWEATFENDLENGVVTCYKPNGEWRRSNLVKGVRHGKDTFYFQDFLDSIYCFGYGQYVNGKEEGLWTKKDTTGILLVETTYVNGERIGYFSNRYKNGKLRLIGELRKDGSMKDFKFYDTNGIEKKQNDYLLRVI